MKSIPELSSLARDLRCHIIEMLAEARSGHPGGSLSLADLITGLYFRIMKHDPRNPHDPDRDILVLSKGHGVPAVYAALAMTGYFPIADLKTLRRTGSFLQGHPDRLRCPGIEASTGSLGQGLSVAQGYALGKRLSGQNDQKVFCLLGDGEIQEGQIWETAMSAPKFELGNLVAILDYNHGQIDGPVEKVMPLEPLAEKWKSFGWSVSTINGHDMGQIINTIEGLSPRAKQPHFVIAQTVKGKGVSFMEHKIEWHGSAPSKEQAQKALAEIKSGGAQ